MPRPSYDWNKIADHFGYSDGAGFLNQLYTIEQHNYPYIARLSGTTIPSVTRALKRYGIPARSPKAHFGKPVKAVCAYCGETYDRKYTATRRTYCYSQECVDKAKGSKGPRIRRGRYMSKAAPPAKKGNKPHKQLRYCQFSGCNKPTESLPAGYYFYHPVCHAAVSRDMGMDYEHEEMWDYA